MPKRRNSEINIPFPTLSCGIGFIKRTLEQA